MRIGRWIALVSGLIATAVASASEVLPEIYQHLEFARTCLQQGHIDATLASSELILLPHIRVFIDEHDASPSALDAVQRAEDTWRDALGEEVHFDHVRTADQADVTVRFSHCMRREGQEIGGFARWTRAVRRGRWGYESHLSGSIELRLDQPNGLPMNDVQLRHAAMHEFGHILGLDDSTRSGDVMGPMNLSRPALRLAEGEISSLRDVRAQARSLRDTVLSAPGSLDAWHWMP